MQTTSLPSSDSPVILPSQRCQISKLNFDVLYEIFLTAIFFDEAAVDMPLILSQVSPAWRHTVRQNRRLWSRIIVDEEPHASRKHFLTTIKRVKHFLVRSKGLPVDVRITFRDFSLHDSGLRRGNRTLQKAAAINQFGQHIQCLSGVLAPHIWRLQSFKLHAANFETVHDLQLAWPCVALDKLETWEVVLQDTVPMNSFRFTGLPIPFRNDKDDRAGDFYPRLTTVKLSGSPLAFSRFSPQHLKSLTLCFLPEGSLPSLQELSRILVANAQTLEHLSLDFAPNSSSHCEVVALPRLLCLSLEYRHPSDLLPLVKALRLPSIISLSITGHEHAQLFPETWISTSCTFQLLQTLVNQFPLSQLEKLSLIHFRILPVWCSDDIINENHIPGASHLSVIPVRFFASLSQLTSLTLVYPTSTPLDCITYLPREANGTSPVHLLPKLQDLALIDFNLHIVRDFLAALRLCPLRLPLKRIALRMPDAWSKDPHLRTEGLCENSETDFVHYDAAEETDELFRALGVQPHCWSMTPQPRHVWDI
ncbi:hypothetical protein D9615_008185 [Tricholomella constricta]|uniref:F-box domain-containing protein n=1 Tax=Tricholomella constricta TaxID=117010 RepID=A0A8H5H3F6_9AGAR|nr:hypothetical protein D9615_008185 [Tricholomella constricta]